MVIKKNVLLGVLALGMLMQTPVSAAKSNISLKMKQAGCTAIEWFFNGEYQRDYTCSYNDAMHDQTPNAHRHGHYCPRSNGGMCFGTECTMQRSYYTAQSSSPGATAPATEYKKHDQHVCSPTHCPVEDVTLTRSSRNATPSQKILIAFESPAQLAKNAVICALLARAIQGKTSVTDYSKVAGYSFAGAMATSLLHTGAHKGINKMQEKEWSKTALSLGLLALGVEGALFAAGQNPEVVKSMIASIKAKTVGKDLTNFILSLNKDGDRRARLAAVVRTFGPFVLKASLNASAYLPTAAKDLLD